MQLSTVDFCIHEVNNIGHKLLKPLDIYALYMYITVTVWLAIKVDLLLQVGRLFEVRKTP